MPAADVAQLGEARYTVGASVGDAVGNGTSTTHDVVVNTALPQVVIDVIGGDDILNAAEIGAAQTISGRVVNAEAGQVVTASLGGKDYTATVQADGTWSTSVPAADLATLGDGDLKVTATVTNNAGNEGQGNRDITIDAGLPGVRIDTIAGDDIINAIELGQPLIVNGTSTDLAVGSTVTVNVNGKDYSASVGADGSWSLGISTADVAAFPAGELVFTASASDASGNPVSNLHSVTVDLDVVAISIDTVAGDNVLSAAEKGQDLVLSGSTQNVEAGQVVTVNVGGKSHLATVDASGNWTVTVPAVDLKGLKDGVNDISVSVNNVAGNSASAAQEVTVDTSAPTITINTLAGDDILNAAEAGQPLTINGTTVGAEAGQTVTVTLNGKGYTATVAADGSWTLDVPVADVGALVNGNVTVTATVSDKAGNEGSTTHGLLVDTLAPTITIGVVAGDDVINSTEHGQAQTVKGTTTNAVAGDTVSVVINGHTYNTIVNADGTWSVGLPADVVSALSTGKVEIQATVTDKAGNSSSDTHEITVNIDVPTLVIDPIAVDDIINATEKGQDLVLSGTSTNLQLGTVVKVTLNGESYDAIVGATGNWTVTVPAADVMALGETHYTVTATASDDISNTVSTTHEVLVDTALPIITINSVDDDILNAMEVVGDVVISGSVIYAVPGSTGTVTINNKDYAITIENDLSWSVTVPAGDLAGVSNGPLNIDVSVTDAQGNTGNNSHVVNVDVLIPQITINAISGDDVINAAEHNSMVEVSGTTLNTLKGDVVEVTIGKITYLTTVKADGSWTVGIPAKDVSAWQNGSVTVKATATDQAGNSGSENRDITVNTNVPTVQIGQIAGDDIINAQEKAQALDITGTTTNLAVGTIITVTLNGKSYSATVEAGGTWTAKVDAADVAVLENKNYTVSASASDTIGNNVSDTHNVVVNTQSPIVYIDTVAGDDVLNSTEVAAGLTLSGRVVNAEPGSKMVISFNNKNYDTTVDANGNWSIPVSKADLAGIANGNTTVTASVTNSAGNEGTGSHTVVVDTIAPSVTIDVVAGDDIINAVEHKGMVELKGTATNATAGDQITITINGHTIYATVNADGVSWNAGIPANIVSSLADNNYKVTVVVTDKAGNSSHAERDITVNTSDPKVGIDVIAGDDIINATEKGSELTITGTSSDVVGREITVTLNGKAYKVTVVSSDGTWSLKVPAADVAALGEAAYTVTASVTDSIGNGASGTHIVSVNTAVPTIVFDKVAGDDIINATEINNGHTVGGTVFNAEVGQKITVTINGQEHTATVLAGGKWSILVTAAEWKAIGNGDVVITATVSNVAGNSSTATHDVLIDANLPGIRIGVVSGDDIINSIEHGQDLTIKGSSQGFDAGATIVVKVNGINYNATVGSDGNWQVNIPASDVSALPQGTLNINANGTNAVGNAVGDTHKVVVDLGSVAISIDSITDDDIINAAEKGQDLKFSGSVSGVEVGQDITLVIGGITYTTKVLAGNRWEHTLTANALATLPEGVLDIKVSVENQAGNTASSQREATIDSEVPSITINTISGDNMINAAEKAQNLDITGTTYGLELGRQITVNIGGKDYVTTVAKDGSWKVTLTPADISSLADKTYTVTASTSDVAKNPASATQDVIVDTVKPTITIDAFTGDDIINAAEHSANQVVTGTSNAIGQIISVTVGGVTARVEVQQDGTWTAGFAANVINGLKEGTNTITVSVSDKAGNSNSATSNFEVASGLPSLTFDPISGDNVINAVEHGQSLDITGTASNNLIGRDVTVTLNGKTYTVTVQADNTWKLTVDAVDVGALDQSYYKVTVSATDVANNPANTSSDVYLDLVPPSLTVDKIAGDDVINAIEHGKDLVISGTYGGAENGQTVNVVINGQTHSVIVTGDGKWSVTVPASEVAALQNGSEKVEVSLSDKAGNIVTVEHPITIDTVAPTITIDKVTGDDSISMDEQAAGVKISGTTTAEPNQILTVTFMGRPYQATVQPDGTWEITVPPAHFTGVTDGRYDITATVTDQAGNPSLVITHPVDVTSLKPALTINDFATDNIVNIDEHQLMQTISGTSDAIGKTVTVTLNGKTYISSVVDASGNWSLSVSATDMQALAEGLTKIHAEVIGATGNKGTIDRDIEIDLTAPTAKLVIDSITTDTGASSTDFITSDNTFTINGSLQGTMGAGDKAEISLDGGQTWQAVTLVNIGGVITWTLANATALPDGKYEYLMRVIDRAGNEGPGSKQIIEVDTTASTSTIVIDHITNDTGSSSSDFITSDQSPTLYGTLSKALETNETLQIRLNGGDWVTVTAVNGTDWNFATVNPLADGKNTYEMRILDVAGNPSTPVSKDIIVDTVNPLSGISIDSYTDNEGDRSGTYTLDMHPVTDDTTPTLNISLTQALAAGEVVQVFRDNVFVGVAAFTGGKWTFTDSGLSDGSYVYTAKIVDLAGNTTGSSDFKLTVDTTRPTTTATVTAQTTTDHTPIISGVVSGDLVNGQYVEVTVNGKKYTSENGGLVVVDPLNHTWYLQVPNSDTLASANYTVTTQVKSGAGNGNQAGIQTGNVIVNDEASLTPSWTTGTTSRNGTGATFTVDANGLWMISANQQIVSSKDVNTYSKQSYTMSQGNSINSTFADFNRDGYADMVVSSSNWDTLQILTNNGAGGFTNRNLSGQDADIWYGSVVAFDREGDGYIDFVIGDAGGPDSSTFIYNKGGTLAYSSKNGAQNSGNVKAGDKVDRYYSLMEGSGVDLNNDGKVDIAQHTTVNGNNYTLSTLVNQGDGTFKWGQNIANTFFSGSGEAAAANSVSMTWADFDGDGSMDLYLATSRLNASTSQGVVMLNDGSGNLGAAQKVGTTATDIYASNISVAVDWDHDGNMDIIKLAQTTGKSYLYVNDGVKGVASFTSQAFGAAGSSSKVSGAALLDYDWDGAQDLLIFRQNGTVQLEQNTNTVAEGTSIHLKILDGEGINSFYGNTVRLYDSSGKLVASQIINAQSGVGINDASALVNFYGLNANETYRAELVRSVGTTSSNVNETINQTWGGLTAQEATHNYVLSAENSSASNNGKFVGTGYNDTFFATAGTDTYNGSGGWETTSDHSTWSATGGMDIVDFKLSTVGVNVDLSKAGAQNTNFNVATFTDIEGIAGTNQADTLTSGKGNNMFDGRGGNDTFNLNGGAGHDTLLYNLLNKADATGGNGSDTVNGFTVGTWEGTADTDRIDIRDLLQGSGYTGTGSASYVDGVATLDSGAGNIMDFITVKTENGNTVISVDRDGSGGSYAPTPLVTLTGVQTDLATLLANHQLLVI